MTATAPPARITGIYRYPVKGLTPEQLARAELSPGQTLLADRRYAIENGPSGFDPAEPKWLAKPHFLMLMRDEWLAGLRSRFDDSSNVLSINHNGRIVTEGDLSTPEGRQTIENFRATEGMVGAPVHPLRFRANLYVEGWPAWHEFDLLDRTLSIGDVRLKVVKRIVRCAAVNVDPDTAARDLAIPTALQRRLGHGDCGIYAEVIAGGTISADDTIAAEQPELL